jgi:iron complex outermembrane receptor protein
LLASISTLGGNNFEATRGDRRVLELYAESILPLWKSGDGLRSLDLEAALRMSDYSDFGSTTNPKVSLRWQFAPSLLLRGNYAAGFRAPSLNELYQGRTEEQAFISDPCTQPRNVGTLPGCSQLADPTRNQFLVLQGGNPDLDAETADSYSLGMLWTPGHIPGFALSVDYFAIDQADVVSSSAQFIVDQNARFDAFDDRVERDDMGNLRLVTADNINIGERSVKGMDFAFTWHLPAGSWGKVSVTGGASWIWEYITRLDKSAPELDLAGTFRDEASEGLGGIPEWKSQLGLRWQRTRWTGSYQMHYVSELDEEVPLSGRTRSINSWMVHDLQLSYTFPVLNGLRLTLGVDNVLDEEAPLATSAFNDNIDGRTHELKGRYWYTRLSQRI